MNQAAVYCFPEVLALCKHNLENLLIKTSRTLDLASHIAQEPWHYFYEDRTFIKQITFSEGLALTNCTYSVLDHMLSP